VDFIGLRGGQRQRIGELGGVIVSKESEGLRGEKGGD
jgi:hypothetical protein